MGEDGECAGAGQSDLRVVVCSGRRYPACRERARGEVDVDDVTLRRSPTADFSSPSGWNFARCSGEGSYTTTVLDEGRRRRRTLSDFTIGVG